MKALFASVKTKSRRAFMGLLKMSAPFLFPSWPGASEESQILSPFRLVFLDGMQGIPTTGDFSTIMWEFSGPRSFVTHAPAMPPDLHAGTGFPAKPCRAPTRPAGGSPGSRRAHSPLKRREVSRVGPRGCRAPRQLPRRLERMGTALGPCLLFTLWAS